MASAIAQQIRLSVSRDLAPAAISARLAAFAKADSARRVAAGEFPAVFTRYVDGRQGAAEETVSAGGLIDYVANLLPQVAAFALGAAVGRSPERSGRFKHSWVFLVDGKLWTADIAGIPSSALLTLTNFQPYSRKIDMGHMRMSVPPGIVEDVRQTLLRKFGSNVLSVERAFITLPGGYVLKGRHRSRSLRSLADWHGVPKEVIQGWLAEGRNVDGAPSSSASAGQQMTYPSLEIRQLL